MERAAIILAFVGAGECVDVSIDCDVSQKGRLRRARPATQLEPARSGDFRPIGKRWRNGQSTGRA
eukprot:11165385-Lingulodinium_polyedra.AAC.1